MALAFLSFILRTFLLGHPQDSSTSAILILWVVRIVMLSLLFRTFLGPAVVRLVSKRLRVRSISLRSIRGIYFRAGSGTWRIERIGISYHRPSPTSASRFSFVVEGLNVQLRRSEQDVGLRPSLARRHSGFSPSNLPPLAQYAQRFLRSTFRHTYRYLEPYLRPIIRTVVVSILRLIIRALPTLTHVLDFELNTAVVTFLDIPGIELALKQANFHTTVSLSSLDVKALPDDTSRLQRLRGHKRFASVADWNARLAASVRRTWDRAWGATQVAASVSLRLHDIKGAANSALSRELPTGVTFGNESFIDVPSTNFTASVRLNPHKTVESHSIETYLISDSVDVNVDIMNFLLQKMKKCRPHTDASHVLRPSTNGLTTTEPKEMSPSSLSPGLSPLSKRRLTFSPISPGSPIMDALSSASMRFGWGTRNTPIRKLTHQEAISRLSILKAIDLNITKVTLSHCPAFAPVEQDLAQIFKATLHEIRLGVGLSHPDVSPLHREHLGSRSVPDDALSADAYRLRFSMSSFSLDRVGRGAVVDHLRVASTGPLRADSIISQWPTPWLVGSTFLSGDPNSQLLAVNIDLGPVQVTERMEVLLSLLEKKPQEELPKETRSLWPTVLKSVPRIAFGLKIGPVIARVIYPSSQDGEEPFALEVRSDGLAVSLDSRYHSVPDRHLGLTLHDHIGLQMNISLACALHGAFVSVCFGNNLHRDHHHTTSVGTSEITGERLLSLDTLQLSGHGTALGDIADDAKGVITLDLPSMFVDLQCSTEAISVELWQPDVLKAISRFTKRLAKRPRPRLRRAPHPSQPPALDGLPFGLSTLFCIGRFVVFVTGPDVTPGEDLGIHRGIATHTGVCVSYCAVHSRHSEMMNSLLSRSQKRLRLSLPTEHIVKAVVGTTVPATTPNIRTLFGVSLWDLALRDAVSTPFTADDPYCIGDRDANFKSRQFLRIKSITMDVALPGIRSGVSNLAEPKEDTLVTVAVSSIKGTLSLAQLYGILLASNTLKALAPPSHGEAAEPQKSSSAMPLAVQCDIKEVQLLWEFSTHSKLLVRVDYLLCHISPEKKVGVKWSSILLAVALTVTRDGAQQEEWEELARLSNWHIGVPLLVKPLEIAVDAHSGRLRIPHDFVLADLILDVNLTVKSIKHLVRITKSGQFSQPPSPEAEAAKIMPKTTINIRCLTIEAADDELESRMGLIWRMGHAAARIRQERDEAFQAKVSTILYSSQPSTKPQDGDSDFQFSSKHTVSIENARERLFQVHSVAWTSTIRKARLAQISREESYLHQAVGRNMPYSPAEDIVSIKPPSAVPPLCRITFDWLSLTLGTPASLVEKVPDFLYVVGNGLPKDTEFSLLVPLHVKFTLASLRMSYREYPMPLICVPPRSDRSPALKFDSDIVVAEEMGSAASVEWFTVDVIKANSGIHGASPMSLSIPKTIMPVKTYAEPTVHVLTDNATDFAWGNSYSAATQDFMRVIDTLSHAPKDSSPPIGFWDKLRLIFHWRLSFLFEDEVHLHMKGSRDPHELTGPGAGFALCWRGKPKLLIGRPNDQRELIQVISDSMLVVIPNVQDVWGDSVSGENTHTPSVSSAPFTNFNPRRSRESKVCAKLSSGVRFGVGFVLERACGPECEACSGKPFDRKCRFFDFKPHYDVRLGTKTQKPEYKSGDDSYNGFRSDFIHMSISLTSALYGNPLAHSSSVHLSPEVFEHFWAWYSLFDSTMSLPIRQGSLYSRKRPVTPKFGQHLATLKYQVSVVRLFLSHLYVDNTKDAWTDGVTPFVGIKALIDHFQADMHQRDQETCRVIDGNMQSVHHKAFYAIEVVMKGLDLRSILAIFPEPLKQEVRMESSPLVSNYRTQIKSEPIPAESPWIDSDDYDEPGWSRSTAPIVHLFPAAYCPQFTYFKRIVDPSGSHSPEPLQMRSKFGAEDTHVCVLGKEASVTQVQIALTGARIKELQQKVTEKAAQHSHGLSHSNFVGNEDESDLRKKIILLDNYAMHLHKVDATSNTAGSQGYQSYYMPSDVVSADEWAEFDHVYQVHSPQIFMDYVIRDIMMQYYYCSRTKRGIEYHMATRAVKFIRDQAKAALADLLQEQEHSSRGPVAGAQAAALAVRNFLVGENTSRIEVEPSPISLADTPQAVSPLDGWSQGVSLEKAHFCLLLKPQIVLRSEAKMDNDSDSVCVLAAVQGKLKSYDILDNTTADDPVSGKVMSRTFASITGLQTFSPSATNKAGRSHVPLEVLIDLRCENSDFDRLVPQTDASLQYDKFNRLRLGTDNTSVAQTSHDPGRRQEHLKNQTDLVRVHIPRFTMSAKERHFQAVANIVTGLILFSDAALKERAEKLEKMLFSYDFTNLGSAADVVASIQARLRHALEVRREAMRQLQGKGKDGQIEIFKIDAHIFVLAEELNLVFDAINLAQDKAKGQTSEQKSALLLHASSSEISWRMLDQQDQLLAKLAVRNINFQWLSRQDSSTVNTLVVGDLQAFDGSADAEWTEILSKHDEPSTHPLVKQKLFLFADWTVLPPVGGITIYERFELTLHPMRLQIDTRIGRKIMEYIWPARRHRKKTDDDLQPFPDSPSAVESPHSNIIIIPESASPRRSSWDVSPRKDVDSARLAPAPLRKLGSSRSFTDLRKARADSPTPSKLHKTRSTNALKLSEPTASGESVGRKGTVEMTHRSNSTRTQEVDDATEMKTRSSQKTFVWVRVNSLHLLLSIAKEDSFLCRDARIRTRDLEYRNRTWSFEDIVDQFIPSGKNWRGWVKMAFNQPLVPVLPVARELIAKTKFISHRSHSHAHDDPQRSYSSSLLTPFHARHTGTGSAASLGSGTVTESKRSLTLPRFPRSRKTLPHILSDDLTAEPEPLHETEKSNPQKRTRARVLSVFKRKQSSGTRSSMDSEVSGTSVSSRPTGFFAQEDLNAAD